MGLTGPETEKEVTEMMTVHQTTGACATCGGVSTRDVNVDARHSVCAQGHVMRWGHCSAKRDHVAHQWGAGAVGRMHCSGVAMKHGTAKGDA